MAVTSTIQRLFDRRPPWVDLIVIGLFVAWFYSPFLQPGVPPGDFASDVMVGAVNDRLTPTVLSVATWNSYRMCGRPTWLYPSPTDLLELPFARLDPIARLKALVVLYHVLAGLAMYWLVFGTGCGKDAALFGGLVYPIMTSHVTRTAVQGHVGVVMFYAFAPLLLLALFRCGARGVRGIVLVALATALCLHRDEQRTLLLCVMLGIVLTILAAIDLVRGFRQRIERPIAAAIALPCRFAAAFAIAVAINAADLVTGFLGDPFVGGWRSGEQDRWIAKWSVDNLYSLVDRDAVVGRALEPLSPLFDISISRYVGISLLLLVIAGALAPRRLGDHRRPFWTALLLFPISVWLSFGATPILGMVIERWHFFVTEPVIPVLAKLGALVGVAACLAAVAAAFANNFPRLERRWAWGAVACGAFVALLLGTAPMPLVRRVVFFLRDFRNPDWFGVTAISIAVAFPAAMAVGSLRDRRLVRRFWPFVFVALVLLTLADFWPYRKYLTEYQSAPDEVAELARLYSTVADDPEDVRVLPAETYNNRTDLGFLWHGKRLAWDFRSYAAPLRTRQLVEVIHDLYQAGRLDEVAVLAGLANVKYVVDDRSYRKKPALSTKLRRVVQSEWLWIYENLAYRPFVQAWPEARVLVGGEGEPGVVLTASLAQRNVGLVRLERGVDLARLASGRVVYADGPARSSGSAPDRALALEAAVPPVEAARFEIEPELRWSRPEPERIQVDSASASDFLLVVSESFHPWWRATLDGRPVEVEAAEYAFLGVFVPKGRHLVELSLHLPKSYTFCASVSIVSLLACLTLLALSGKGVRSLFFALRKKGT